MTTVAAVKLSRSSFAGEAAAEAWAHDHGYSIRRPQHTEDAYVFAQANAVGTAEWAVGDGASVLVARAEPAPGPKPNPWDLALENLLDLAELVRSWEVAARKPAEKAMRAGYTDRAEDIGLRLRFNVEAPRVALFLTDRTAAKVTTIAETQIDMMRTVIAKAMEDQATVQEVASRLRDHFEDGSAAWASRIARTETNGLYTQAGLWAMSDGGIEMKEWLSARDSNVRDSHVQADGQRVKMDEDFVLAGGRGPGPGLIDSPEESINCRCTTVPIFVAEGDVTAARAEKWAQHDARLVAAEVAMASEWMRLFRELGESVAAKVEALA